MTVTDLVGPHVVLLATGGTISSRASEAGGAAVASDTGEQVFASMGVPAAHPVRVVDVFRKGSYLLTVDDMIAICATIRQALADPQVLGVVVTHGTDTMEETAYLADLTHDDPRPVVFTGAQQAADSRLPGRSRQSVPRDRRRRFAAGAGNGCAAGVCRDHLPCGRRPEAPHNEARCLRQPGLRNRGIGVRLRRGRASRRSGPASSPLPLPGVGAGSPRVDLVAAYPGADATLLRAALQAGAAGIVLQGTGTGNANRVLCQEVADATAAGVVVVTSTRVEAGAVVPRYGDGGGDDLRAAGAIPSGLLRPSQSLVLLSLLLRLGTPPPGIAETFARRGTLPD